MRIIELTVEQKRLSTAEAELWVTARVEGAGSAVELRGSLAGPRCPNAETVQLAYPLRPMIRPELAADTVAGHITIPEPNLWTPQMRFEYVGAVELWHAGQCVDSRPIRALFKLGSTETPKI